MSAVGGLGGVVLRTGAVELSQHILETMGVGVLRETL